MAEQMNEKEYKKASDIDKNYKRIVLDLKEFILLDVNEQSPKIKSILNEMYEEKLDITNKYIDKVLNVAFDVGDNVIYLPKSLKVEKVGSKLVFEFAHKHQGLWIILFALGFLFIGGAATYAGLQYINAQKFNIDLNGDSIPDLNIDIDNDGVCDINCDTNNDNKPDYNIDYQGDHKSHFNKKMADGTIKNPVNQDYDNDGVCDINCDTNNDGWPDINIDLDGDGNIDTFVDTNQDNLPDLNIDTNKDGIPDVNVDLNGDGRCDFNCIDKQTNNFSKELNKDLDHDGVCDVNCDLNNDGIPDTNVDYNGNNNPTFNKEESDGSLSNKTNQDKNGDGYCDLNCDIDKDGWPDTNLDLDNDGKPDLNVDSNHDGIPDLNIDGDNDGKPDFNIDENHDNICDLKCINQIPKDLNQDKDGDGYCDLNCDVNHDGIPDLNIDMDNDGKPDLNIDENHDNICDVNCVVSPVGDLNQDLDDDGVCDLNCDINKDGIPDLNIDTDHDNKPDLNIDDDHDGMCDRNCSAVVGGNVSQEGEGELGGGSASLYVLFESGSKVVTENLFPDDQNVPGLNTKVEPLKFTITNMSSVTLYYDLSWIEIENTFTSDNFWYQVDSMGGYTHEYTKAPTQDETFAQKIAIEPGATHSYTINMTLHGTGENQNYDQGKVFKGKIEVTLSNNGLS